MITSVMQDHLGMIYRVENKDSKLVLSSVSTEEFKYKDTELRRMKCKAYTFTLIDLLLTVVTFTMYMKFKKFLHMCTWNFDLMLVFISMFSLISFFTNFYQLYLLKK